MQRSAKAGEAPAAPLGDSLVAADPHRRSGSCGLEPESRLEHRLFNDRWVSNLLPTSSVEEVKLSSSLHQLARLLRVKHYKQCSFHASRAAHILLIPNITRFCEDRYVR